MIFSSPIEFATADRPVDIPRTWFYSYSFYRIGTILCTAFMYCTIVMIPISMGNVCNLYSREDVMKYSKSDLNRIKSTNFEIVDHCEGKCLLTKNVSDVLSLAKSLFGKIR